MEPELLASPPASDRGSVWKGIGLLALLHLIQLPLAPFLFGWLFISVSQLVYVIPAAVIQGRKGRRDTVKGIWIGAGITALLNAICFGVLCAPMAMR